MASKKIQVVTRQMYLSAKMLAKESLKRKEGPLTREGLSEALSIQEGTAGDLLALLNYGRYVGSTNEDIEVAGTELLLTDIHIPYHDQEAVDVALEYGKKVKADTIVLLGDIMDCYQISRYSKDPKKKPLSYEIEETKKFLTNLRKRFPKARIIYYRGNHEMRLEKYIADCAPALYDIVGNLLQTQLTFAELGIEYRTEPFRIGRLWHLHGHEKPGAFGAEHLPNVMWKYVHDHCIFGHFHRNQSKIFKKITGERYWVGSVGYLAGPQDYAPLNQWGQGFATIEYDTDGRFKASIHEIVDGRIY